MSIARTPIPHVVAAYVELLLRHDLFDEAEAGLKKLEAKRPDDLDAAVLRAHWLRGKGQPEKIEPLLEPLAEKIVKTVAERTRPTRRSSCLTMGDLLFLARTA